MKKIYFLFLLFFSSVSVYCQLNMQLLDQVDYNVNVNDVWGWVHPTSGDEFAIVGLNSGVSIVDVSDPNNSVEVQFISGPNSTWRDIKSWGNFVYVTNESSGGILVVDMSGAPDMITWDRWEPDISGLGTLSECHNLYIDEFGFCYFAGCNLNSGGVIIANVNVSSGTPSFVATGPAIYAHDVFAQNNKMYTSEIYGGDLGIYDVVNKQNIISQASQQTPFNFTHNAWVNEDNSVVFTTDEKANAPVTAYDISDLNDIVELDQFRPIQTLSQNVIPHNVHVWNDWLIISYYTDGGIIADASRPENIIEVGNWDTFLGGNGGFSGVWGAYPFLPSGLVLLTDRGNGLFVCGADYVRACWLEGLITDAVSGAAIFGAEVAINSTQANFASADFLGEYKTGQAISGTFEVTYSASGYLSKTISVTLENGVLTTQDVMLEPIVQVDSYSGTLLSAVDGSPIGAAQVLLESQTYRFTTFTNQDGEFTFDNIFRDEYTIAAAKWGYQHAVEYNILIDQNTPPITMEAYLGYQDDFFVSLGWTTQTTASEGWWTRGNPQGTLLNGEQANPNMDISGDISDQCFVTGNNGGAASEDDVDDGYVRLRSPKMDLTIYYQPEISYDSWFFNEGNSGTPNDTFLISIDNGIEEVIVETITTSSSQWRDRSSFLVSDFIEITDDMRIIFQASDRAGSSHIVEAAIDAFKVTETDFPVVIPDTINACQNMLIPFEDLSSYAYDWNWVFENGNPATSNEQSPEVAYDLAGLFDVQLQVQTITGADFNLLYEDLVDIQSAPAADFMVQQIDTLSVDFQNLSAHSDTYSWDFGDGMTSTASNPNHLFSTPGNYMVSLSATGECGSDLMTIEVVIPEFQPTASFGQNATTGCAPVTVQFEDQSLGFPSSWQWSFPGGTPSSSTEQNPLVVYETMGEYEVSLTAINSAGSTISTQTNLINVNDVPTIDFDFTVDGPTVDFTNNSSNSDGYTWTFNDGLGSTSDLADPMLEFPQVGTYEVTLTGENTCGSNELTQSVIISALPPTAQFSADQYTGCAPLTVQFNDLSLDVPTEWEWTFPGGTPATSNEQNPSVVYNSSGIYNVTLSVSNGAGTSEILLTDTIEINGLPDPDFSFDINGPVVSFSNNSTNYQDLLWHFNDGSGVSSTDVSPTHEFPAIGSYDVTLALTNECGTSESSQTVNIGMVQPTAAFESNHQSGCAPLTVSFQDLSTGGMIENWEWSFPGGTPSSSNDPNPEVTYNTPGNYDVTLLVKNAIGESEIVSAGLILITDIPDAAFNITQTGPLIQFNNNSLNADSLSWHFGDNSNNNSQESNPTFLYEDIGDYMVVLETFNACGSDTDTLIVSITSVLPNAAFSFEQNDSCVPFEVSFNDISIGGEIETYEWSFPGGTPAVSNEPNPIITYATAGSYDVGLKITNPNGESEINDFDLIVADDIPTIGFNFIVDGFEVQFSNSSENATEYSWDFADGSGIISTEENPIYVFPDSGTYDVILTAINACGDTTLSQSVFIDATTSLDQTISGRANLTAYPNPFSDQFLIDFEINHSFNNAAIIITDIAGQLIDKQVISEQNGQLQFDQHFLNPGVYFIQIIVNDKKYPSLKIVKI